MSWYLLFTASCRSQAENTLIPVVQIPRASSILNDSVTWEAMFRRQLWSTVSATISRSGGGSTVQDWIALARSSLNRVYSPRKFTVKLIPAIRNVGSKDSLFDEIVYTGSGLISRLAELQNPNYDKREDNDLFHRINQFVREPLINRPGIELARGI